MLSKAGSMWEQHKEVFVLKSINNVVIILSVRCKECGNTSDLRAKDLCLQLYAGVSYYNYS